MKPTLLVLCAIFTSPLGWVYAHESTDHMTLGEVLRESKWDRLIGTWVDAETKGDALKSTFAWKFKDHLVQITTWDSEKESFSLMGRNPKSGAIFHMSAGSTGDSSIGKWELTKSEAILGLLFVTGKGEEGALRIRHQLQGDDMMLVIIDLPEPITIKMIRIKKGDYSYRTKGKLDWKAIKTRIESAVQRGDLTRKEADEKYRQIKDLQLKHVPVKSNN